MFTVYHMLYFQEDNFRVPSKVRNKHTAEGALNWSFQMKSMWNVCVSVYILKGSHILFFTNWSWNRPKRKLFPTFPKSFAMIGFQSL